jgi:hypothetical protein
MRQRFLETAWRRIETVPGLRMEVLHAVAYDTVEGQLDRHDEPWKTDTSAAAGRKTISSVFSTAQTAGWQ